MAADALPPPADENGGAKPLSVTPTGSKKAKAAARKTPQMNGHDHLEKGPITEDHQFGIVYSRRGKTAERTCFLQALLLDAELEDHQFGIVYSRRGKTAERTCFLQALLLDIELEAKGKSVVKGRKLGRGAE